MAWTPFHDRLDSHPTSGPQRTVSLLIFMGVAMCVVANLLADEVEVTRLPKQTFWLLLAAQISVVLALVTVVHVSRSGDEQTPWTRSFVRALEPLDTSYVGGMLAAFGGHAVYLKGDDLHGLVLGIIGVLLWIGCMVWMVRAVRQQP